MRCTDFTPGSCSQAKSCHTSRSRPDSDQWDARAVERSPTYAEGTSEGTSRSSERYQAACSDRRQRFTITGSSCRGTLHRHINAQRMCLLVCPHLSLMKNPRRYSQTKKYLLSPFIMSIAVAIERCRDNAQDMHTSCAANSRPSFFLYQSMMRPTKGEIKLAPASAQAAACKATSRTLKQPLTRHFLDCNLAQAQNAGAQHLQLVITRIHQQLISPAAAWNINCGLHADRPPHHCLTASRQLADV